MATHETLLSLAARSASGTNVPTMPTYKFAGAAFLLDVTSAAADVGDTLNVRVQHSCDGGSNYDDFVSFTQVLGNGGAKQFTAMWTPFALPDSEMHALADGTLAAGGVLQGPVGMKWRVKWAIVDSGDADQTFTFALYASFLPS